MFKTVINNKQFRYLICGGITAAFNLAVIFLLVEVLKLDTPTLRNFANMIAIEISIVFSFFVYRFWVWTKASWRFKQIFLRQIPLYHLSTGSSVLLRSFIIFPALNFLGINYLANTTIGIVIGAAMNYFFNDKIVFSK